MISVIIAGGSGTRLWPLSTPNYPKHLLQLTDSNSLLQNTLKRVRGVTSDDKILIMPEASHSHHVEAQLPDFPKENLLVEPARRGTASCVLLALQHLKKTGVDPDEPIAILWADHLIRDERGFATTFKRAAKLACKHKKVVFIGAEPTYASTGFGYMEHGPAFDDEPQTYELLSFHEKPTRQKAEQYYSSGNFFWNMGYIVATLNTFEKVSESQAPDFWKAYQKLLAAKDVYAAYLKLENVALDYALSEKLKHALVIPGSFDWADIGSFADLHSMSLQNESGNHLRGERIEVDGVSNSYIRNDGDKPVAVIGLDNVIVVQSPHGILVANKNFSQKVGDIARKLS